MTPSSNPFQITGFAQKRAWEERVLPPTEQVASDVWSIAVNFGSSPVRHTFAYILANSHGEFVIVDPGWDSPSSIAELGAGVQAAGLEMSNLVGCVITHMHPDHLAMAREICHGEVWVGMHPREFAYLTRQSARAETMSRDGRWLEIVGVPSSRRSDLALQPHDLDYLENGDYSTLELEDDALIPLRDRRLRVVATPGHTAGHICIIDEDNQFILTGDHVLPRITPNVGIYVDDLDRSPLGEYVRSLTKMSAFDEYAVLPAHEYRFRGLTDRSSQLIEHHAERSRELLTVLGSLGSLSAWDASAAMSWSRGWGSLDGINLRSALAETLAHMVELHREGAIALDRNPSGGWRASLSTQYTGDGATNA